MAGRLALDWVRRSGRTLWSPAAPDAPARAVLSALGRGFGADRADAASPLEKAWAEQAFMAAACGDFARLRALARDGARPYAVIGDSHGRLLVRRSRRADGAWLLPLWWLETGASARGLGQVEARSGAGPRVRAALAQALGAADDLPVLVKFGQVDLEFVQVFKRLESGRRDFDAADFQAFADESVARYAAFLDQAVAPADRARVRVCSLFPPTLSDAAWRAGYVNAHLAQLHGPADQAGLAERLATLELPDQAARTALHAAFDANLTQAVTTLGFGVSDQLTPFLGTGGVVDPAYVGPASGADHHLDFHASRAPVVDRLWRVFEGSR